MRPSPTALRHACALLSTVLLAALLVTASGAPSAPPTRDLQLTSGSTYLCAGYAGCRNEGYSDGGYGSVNDRSYWNMYPGHNCTNYVAYRMIQAGMSPQRPFGYPGNATNWGDHLADQVNATPSVGSVAWWRANDNGSGSAGHVAYVEHVTSDYIVISEDSWGWTFHWRKIERGSSRWPTGFIHFRQPRIENVVRPRIWGSATVGKQLKAGTGDWKPQGVKSYQWFANGKRLAGETGRYLTLSPDHRGQRISHRVRVTRTGWESGQRTSVPTSAVAPGVLTVTQSPTVSGTAEVGGTLSADPGAVSPEAEGQRIQWRANGMPIEGATGPTFTVPPDVVGARISVRVVASKDGYRNRRMFSTPTSAVEVGEFTVTQSPTVSGAAEVGGTVRVDPGGVSPDAEVQQVQWRANGMPIKGATGPTFTLPPDVVGARISARVVASRDGYRNRTMYSAPTSAVELGELTVSRPPTVSGTPAVGHVVSVDPGVVSPEAEGHRIEWRANGVPIKGATGRKLTLTSDQAGARITARVVFTKAGYREHAAVSSPTGWVRDGVLAVERAAAVKGRAVVGAPLVVDPGTTRPDTDVTTRYQWIRNNRAIPGATGRRYRLTAADFGHRVGVRVAHSHPRYFDAKSRAVVGRQIRSKPKIATQVRVADPAGHTVVVRATLSHAAAGPVRGRVSIRVGGQVRLRWVNNGAARAVFRGVQHGSRPVVVRFYPNSRFLWAANRQQFDVEPR